MFKWFEFPPQKKTFFGGSIFQTPIYKFNNKLLFFIWGT